MGRCRGKTDLRIRPCISNVLGKSHQMNKPSIHSVIIEPNQEIKAEFTASTTPWPQAANSANVSFDWCKITLKKFIESFPNVESFDTIHFVASLYYVDVE